jgi:hypothetical protein
MVSFAQVSMIAEFSPSSAPRLIHAVSAHRRGQLAHEEDYDDRGNHALVLARALLHSSSRRGFAPVLQTIRAYACRAEHLTKFLEALAVAAGEREETGAICRAEWPTIIETVLELHAKGTESFARQRYSYKTPLAYALPRPKIGDHEYLYREISGPGVTWTDVMAWEEALDRWAEVAKSDPNCVDSLISLLVTLNVGDQARFGLPRVAKLVLANADEMIGRSWHIQGWLPEIRDSAELEDMLDLWQQVVDALVVAGSTSLAAYSE